MDDGATTTGRARVVEKLVFRQTVSYPAQAVSKFSLSPPRSVILSCWRLATPFVEKIRELFSDFFFVNITTSLFEMSIGYDNVKIVHF